MLGRLDRGMHGNNRPPFLKRAVTDPQIRRDIDHAKEWAVAPTVYWGRDTGPRWTPEDRAVLDALDDYEATLCPGCGQPMSSHDGKTAADYTAAAITCPSLQALDRDQVAQARRDGHTDQKPDPERARRWIHGDRKHITEWAKQFQ